MGYKNIIMFWKKDDTLKQLKQLNEILKKSFANVKRDTANIFQWLNYFYRKNMEQEQMIKRLQFETASMPKIREEIRRIIDDYYPINNVIAKVRELSEKVDELSKKPQFERQIPPLQYDLSYFEKKLERLEQKRTSMKEKIIKRFTRNSKEYIKSVILSYIKKYEKISALQLREIVVDEQNFCSKSTFYRLLQEVEEMGEIGIVWHGKEKHYIAKAKAYVK